MSGFIKQGYITSALPLNAYYKLIKKYIILGTILRVPKNYT